MTRKKHGARDGLISLLRRVTCLLAVCACFQNAAAATPARQIWTGGSATSDNWSDAANWGGHTIGTGDSLVFSGSMRLTPFNDLPAGMSFDSISFDGPNFVLSGNAVVLSATATPCVSNSAANATVNLGLQQISGKISGGSTAPGLQLNGGAQVSGALQFLSGNAVINSVFSGTGTITVTGTVTYTATQAYSGGTMVAGTLILASPNALPPVGLCTLQTGSTLSLAASQIIGGGLSGAGTIAATDPAGVTWTDTTTVSEAFSGIIAGLLSYVKTGSGTMQFSGSSTTYTGPSTVSGGVLSLASTSGLGSNATANTGGQVQITLATFSSPLTLNGGTLWASGATTGASVSILAPSTIRADSTFNATTQGAGFTKTSTGTLTLSGNSAVSSAIAVNAGSLSMSAVNISAPVTVNTGGTLLGTGTVGAVTLSGGTFAPSPGVFSTGNLSASTGSFLRFTVNGNAPGAYSQISVAGNVNLTLASASVAGTGLAGGQMVTVLTNDGTDPIGSFFNIKEGGVLSSVYRVSYFGGDGNDLVLSHVTSITPAALKFSALTFDLPVIFENDTAVLNGIVSATFPGSPIVVTLDWADGSAPETFTLPPGTLTFSKPHFYADDTPKNSIQDTFTISATLYDGTYAGSGTAPLIVKDAPPANLVLGLSAPAINEGGSVTLNGSFSDVGALDTHTVLINWGDTATDTLLLPAGTFIFSAAHTYADDGVSIAPADVYPILVTVTDDDTGSVQGAIPVTVNNVAPQILSATIAPVVEGDTATLMVSFSDANANDSFTITVDWNDGSPRQSFQHGDTSAFTAKHIYVDNAPVGDYTVLVQVQDKDGGVAFYSVAATVMNAAPALSLGVAPDTINENESVTLSWTVTDPGSLDTFSVNVDWGDGSPADVVALGATQRNFSLTHTFLDDAPTGSFVINAVVRDKDGATGSAMKTITVLNVAPSVSFSGLPENTLVAEGTAITLVSSVIDPGRLDTFVYAWQVLRDGENYAESADADLALVLNDNGVYDISLSVTDSSGAVSNIATAQIMAFNVAPAVDIVAASTNVLAGVPVTLGSHVMDAGTADTFSYAWTVLFNGAPVATGTEDTLTYTPAADGAYTVQLGVTDDDGASGSAEVVLAAAGPVVISGLNAFPNPAQTGAVVTFNSAVQDAENLVWKWDFGDGSPLVATPGSATHLYSVPGAYSATLKVTDDDGAFVMQRAMVTIVPANGTVPAGEIDDDGDGFSNDIEAFLNTDPHDAYSVPFAGPVAALTLTSVDIKLDFRKPNSDALSVKGVLPVPAGFLPAGKTVLLDVGGRVLAFTLDSKGVGAAGKKGGMKLAFGGKAAGTFALALKGIALRDALADEGLVGTTSVSGVHATVPITVIFNQHMLRVARPLIYSATPGVKGEAKDGKTSR